ncbi:hypothetical protein DITRI_Ditri11bG0122800 [Diplodiscus trichospermus]
MKRKYMEGKTKEASAVYHHDDDEEEEEEKINTFFTLVRNIRDAQNQMLIGSLETKEKEKAKGKETKSTWTPSFKWEDFADQDPLLRNNIAKLPASSKIEEQNSKKTKEHQELDLNLSL